MDPFHNTAGNLFELNLSTVRTPQNCRPWVLLLSEEPLSTALLPSTSSSAILFMRGKTRIDSKLNKSRAQLLVVK